jgi:hypothetical protein
VLSYEEKHVSSLNIDNNHNFSACFILLNDNSSTKYSFFRMIIFLYISSISFIFIFFTAIQLLSVYSSLSAANLGHKLSAIGYIS